MPLERITFRPGINQQATKTLNEGGWSDGDKVRFRDGLPQPIGGWTKALQSTFKGVCRGLVTWLSLNATQYIGLATNLRIYVSAAGTLNDVTPIRYSVTATGPYATVAGSPTVGLTVTAHGAAPGDTVILPYAIIGGLTLAGEYAVVSTPTTNTLTITAPANATSTTSGAGGSVLVQFLMSAGSADNKFASGWGAGSWGAGTWGTSRAGLVQSAYARLWSVDHWGEEFLACPRNGPIYDWKPASGLGTRAAIISNAAPIYNKCILVGMPERHLIAFGAESGGTQDPLLIRWSDVEDYTDWTATANNSAGSLRVVGGSQIMTALAAPGEILVWTDATLWALRFEGLPYVYGLFQLGDACGLIAPGAATVMNGVAYWMGLRGFFAYSGQVQPIPCTVWDTVFRNLNTFQQSKIVAAPNLGFNSIRWHYPSAASIENDSYVELNVTTGEWSKGFLAVTAWVDAELFANPMGADPNGNLYRHEFGTDADGAPLDAFLESGFFDIGSGDEIAFVDRVIPDFADQNGPVDITLRSQIYPNGATRSKGPFTLQPSTLQITPRIRGRQVSVRLESNTLGAFWRLGALRVRFAQDGRK